MIAIWQGMCKGENTIFLNFLIKTGSITKIHLLRAINRKLLRNHFLTQASCLRRPRNFAGKNHENMDHLPQKTYQEILYCKKKIKPFRFLGLSFYSEINVIHRFQFSGQTCVKMWPTLLQIISALVSWSVKFSLPVFEFLAKKVEEDLDLRNLNLKLTLRGKNLLDSGEVFSCLSAQLVKLVTRLFPCELGDRASCCK